MIMDLERIICAELNCKENSTTARAVHDPFTNRQYYIRLCTGHAEEFDGYHYTKGGGGSVSTGSSKG